MTVDGDDGLDKSPWYVRVFVRVGMPTAFATILLWYLMTNVTGSQNAIQQSLVELMQVNAVVVKNQESIIQLLMQNAESQRINRAVLLAMCYNQTTSQPEVQRCNDSFR